MNEEKLQMFKNRLRKVYQHRSKLARRQSISCYRLYDHDLPEFPFGIDVYEDKLYVAEYKRNHGMDEEEHNNWLENSIAVMIETTGIPSERIFTRQRQRKAGRQGQYEKVDSRSNEFIVEESGLKFKVNLSDYLDTGLFLDHRITRQMVREESKGKRILNLFSYTGSFSIYAAAGDARETTTVDMSNTYLQWASENMGLNNFSDMASHKFIQGDVMQLLPTLSKNSYDLIILDPPTFSNSKRMKDFMDIQKDHAMLINQSLDVLTPAGLLFFSTNYSKFVLETEKIRSKHIKDITKATTPFDFEGKLNRWCFKILKV